jgi:Ca2+/Na+ antiporter
MAINFDIKDLEKLLSKIPLKKTLAGITLVTGLAVLLPDTLLEKLFILELRNSISVVLGCVFFVSAIIWGVIIATLLFRRIYRTWSFNDRNCYKRFDRLSEDGLSIILEMYNSTSYTMEMDISNATVALLSTMGFISRPSIGTGNGLEFDYYLQPWVIKHLKKHYSEYEKRLSKK